MLNAKLLNALKLRCEMPIEAFRELGDTIDTADGPLTFIDRKADTLAVAHLDFVDWTPPRVSRSGYTIRCPQLDDRLGVWIVLDLLPTLGVRADVLLTDSEERGRSTARYFDPPKDFHWMFQFDRRGTDAVLYEYESDENRERLERFGFDIGSGSFSDICYLDELGISGWNIGTGYHHEHSRRCYANLADTLANARRFAEFWMAHHGERIPAPPVEYGRWFSAPGDWGRGKRSALFSPSDEYLSLDALDSEVWECVCGQVMWLSMPYCDDCGLSIDDQTRYDDMWHEDRESWNEYLLRLETE